MNPQKLHIHSMKKKLITCTFLVLLLTISASASIAQTSTKKVLVFSKTLGYHHKAIKQGIAAIQKLGLANGFGVDSTINSEKFTPVNLKQYAAVVFLNTTGDVLNEEQQTAFEKYIRSGGSFVGVHAAADCEYDWPWYNGLVGAYFAAHPAQQDATLNVLNHKHLSTKHLPKEWIRKDEWYNFKSVAKGLKVLITLDEQSYDPGKEKMGSYHPAAWYRNYDGGRAFYTALGHTEASYEDPLFLQHLLGGIKYALGQKK